MPHVISSSSEPSLATTPVSTGPWFCELSRYQWFVLVVCTLGWGFDCLDQQLFSLARQPAVTALLDVSPGSPEVDKYSGYATSFLLIGWAIGGLIFGILGDRWGRARTMVLTILAYSVFTGLSGFAQSFWEFVFYRFMTGLGVGGQFAVGVTLVAETMPDRARPYALGLLQAFASLSNVAAALIAMGFGRLEQNGIVESDWRWMFAIGALPALLAVIVMWRLEEPEVWRRTMSSPEGRRKAGSLGELFRDSRWRRRAIMGLLLVSSGVVGLWAIGFFSIDLNRTIFRNRAEQAAREAGEAKQDREFVAWLLQSTDHLDAFQEPLGPSSLLSLQPGNDDPQVLLGAAVELRESGEAVSSTLVLDSLDARTSSRDPQGAESRRRWAEYLAVEVPVTFSCLNHAERISARIKRINGDVSWWGAITSMLFNGGAFFGVYAFTLATAHIGRRPAFALGFLLSIISTGGAFLLMKSATDVFWMVPVMGFFQLSLFGGYAIYLPELFPTRLRSTGTSFCYNIARMASAAGPAMLGLLTSEVFTRSRGFEEPMRYAGLTMCGIFVLGLLVLPFAPETKGQPLPE